MRTVARETTEDKKHSKRDKSLTITKSQESVSANARADLVGTAMVQVGSAMALPSLKPSAVTHSPMGTTRRSGTSGNGSASRSRTIALKRPLALSAFGSMSSASASASETVSEAASTASDLVSQSAPMSSPPAPAQMSVAPNPASAMLPQDKRKIRVRKSASREALNRDKDKLKKQAPTSAAAEDSQRSIKAHSEPEAATRQVTSASDPFKEFGYWLLQVPAVMEAQSKDTNVVANIKAFMSSIVQVVNQQQIVGATAQQLQELLAKHDPSNNDVGRQRALFFLQLYQHFLGGHQPRSLNYVPSPESKPQDTPKPKPKLQPQEKRTQHTSSSAAAQPSLTKSQLSTPLSTPTPPLSAAPASPAAHHSTPESTATPPAAAPAIPTLATDASASQDQPKRRIVKLNRNFTSTSTSEHQPIRKKGVVRLL